MSASVHSGNCMAAKASGEPPCGFPYGDNSMAETGIEPVQGLPPEGF